MVKVYKFFWKEIGMDVVGIKATGNYSPFVLERFIHSNKLFNPKTEEFRTFDERYRDLLHKGKCIINEHCLIFKEGFEKDYYNYVENYIKNRTDEDKVLAGLLKDESNLSKIKTYMTLFNQGIFIQEKMSSICGNYFKHEDSLEKILKGTI